MSNGETKQCAATTTPYSSNSLRLSVGEWMAAAIILASLAMALPRIWTALERGKPDRNDRIPFALSYDYKVYRDFTRAVCKPDRIAVLGDSVVWGHYVTADQALAAALQKADGRNTFVNIGLDGAHPVALRGLVKHWGRAIRNQKVIVQWNPLWLTGAARDLSTSKEQSFNHPDLVPQFGGVPAYHPSPEGRVTVEMKRAVPFLAWVEHVRKACFDSKNLFAWAGDNPYACPFSAITFRLPSGAPIPPDTAAVPWDKSGKYSVQNPSWVPLPASLQWKNFLDLIAMLKARGNNVFVVLGPYNEHMLKEPAEATYRQLLVSAGEALAKNRIAHFAPPTLPSELWADSSHPLAEGYAEIARQLQGNAEFRAFVDAR